MNYSIYTADRATHMKIVVLALIGATLVAGVGIAARVTGPETGTQPRIETRIPVMKVGAPVAVTSSGTRTIR